VKETSTPIIGHFSMHCHLVGRRSPVPVACTSRKILESHQTPAISESPTLKHCIGDKKICAREASRLSRIRITKNPDDCDVSRSHHLRNYIWTKRLARCKCGRLSWAFEHWRAKPRAISSDCWRISSSKSVLVGGFDAMITGCGVAL
jgi:hypothetical protein